MNFLSHFYHELPCDDAYFTAGLVLPDILSNYSFRSGEVVKVHVAKLPVDRSGSVASLIDGIKQHYSVDGLFHSSGFFDTNVAMIRQLILGAGISSVERRLYAFAHVRQSYGG
jgi:hypothetical protein